MATNSYNKQKLVRIDEQILNLEYLYERELLREKELGKKTLLLSRGFRYRLDNLYKAKAALIRATGQASSREMSYRITLAERTNEYEDALKELEVLKQRHTEAGVNALLHANAPELRDIWIHELEDLSKEIIKQEARIRNKKRALDNWIDKAGRVSTRDRKIDPSYSADEIAADVNNAQESFKNHMASLKQVEDKPANNASFDLLASNPMEQQFSNASDISIAEHKETSISDIPDPLDPKNQKYKPTIIDL